MPTNRPDLTTHAYRRARRIFLAGNETCHICGHGGADVIDHVDPELPRDLVANWAPAHGVNRCPVCGRNCNGEKGREPLVAVRFDTSRDWYSAATGE